LNGFGLALPTDAPPAPAEYASEAPQSHDSTSIHFGKRSSREPPWIVPILRK
jgi:hypothetical protein